MDVPPFLKTRMWERLDMRKFFQNPPSKGDSGKRVAPRDGNAGQRQPPPHRRQLSYQHHCLCYQGPFTQTIPPIH